MTSCLLFALALAQPSAAIATLEVEASQIHPLLAAYLREHGAPTTRGGTAPSTATAFALDAHTWLTAGHVLGGADNAVLITASGAQIPVTRGLSLWRDDAVTLRGGPEVTPFATAEALPTDEATIIGWQGTPELAQVPGTALLTSRQPLPGRAPGILLRLSADITPGLSGAPVLVDGQLVGMVVAGSDPRSALAGDGLAVPIEPLRQALQHQVHANPRFQVGLRVIPHAEGVQVVGLVTGGPAQHAGLEPGDIITHVDGLAITSPGALAEAIRWGANVWRVTREQETLDLHVRPEAVTDAQAALDLASDRIAINGVFVTAADADLSAWSGFVVVTLRDGTRLITRLDPPARPSASDPR